MGQDSSADSDRASQNTGSHPQIQSPSPRQHPPPVYETQAKVVPTFVGTQQREISDELAASVLDALPSPYQAYGRKPQWLQLYNSRTGGKSFQRLVQAITEKGPTVIIIRIQNSTRVIGAFCDAEWLTVAAREKQSVSNAAARQRASREGQSSSNLYSKPHNQSNVFFGSEQCFVFCAGGEGPDRVGKSGAIYRSHTFANSNFMYLFDTHPQEEKIGIGMGGQPGYFGWFIDRWLEHGECKGVKCTTFQNPRLSEAENWEIDAVEAYAVKPEVVQKLLSDAAAAGKGGQSVLRANADTEADKMLLELHGMHTFSLNERPEC